jgi:hypothetical protein
MYLKDIQKFVEVDYFSLSIISIKKFQQKFFFLYLVVIIVTENLFLV